MVRGYLLSLKIINLAIFAWLYIIFLTSIFDFNTVVLTADNEFVIFAFLGALKNVFSYLIYGLFFLIAYGLAFIFGGGVNSFTFDFIEGFFQGYLSKWFSIPQPELENIPNLILSEFGVLFNDFYLFIFQILFIISIFYAIKGFFKSDPKNSFVAIGSIVLMIIIPLMVVGLRDMLNLFLGSLPPASRPEFVQYIYQMASTNPLDDSLKQIPIDNFFQFIASPVILFAIIFYLLLYHIFI